MKTILLTVFLALPAAAGAQTASVEIDVWHPQAAGWVLITRGSAAGSGTKIHEGGEIDSGAGFVPIIDARVNVGGGGAVGLRYAPISLAGETTTPEGFIYRGTPFAAGRRIETRLILTTTGLDYRHSWRLDGRVTLTGHLGLDHWRYSGRVRTDDALLPLSERRSFSSLYWSGGADVDFPLHERLDGRLEFRGGVNEHNKYSFDVDAGAAWRPAKGVSVGAGWRLHSLRFDHVTNEGNLQFSGPYLGMEVSF